MSENNSNLNKEKIWNINCKYIISQIFTLINHYKLLKIVQYNIQLQKILNINISDYKKCFDTIIEIIPTNYIKGSLINIMESPYCHIYINDNQTETNNFNNERREIIKKVKLLIDYDFNSFELLFRGCTCIKKINFIKFKRIDLIKANNMFDSCTKLEELDISNFKTDNITDMSYMFNECISLKKLNIKNFNTNKVKNMMFMFHHCKLLEELDLSNFNTNNVTNMSKMFRGCSSLKKENIIIKDKNSLNKMLEEF